MSETRVTMLDDEIIIEWGNVAVASLSEDGFGYAIREGDKFRAGKHEDDIVGAVKEIREALSVK